MRCLFVSSEVAGFAKTGGLADVSAALPRALAERGIETAVIMPLYRSVRDGSQPIESTPHVLRVSLGNRLGEGRLCRTTLPGTDIPVFLVEHTGYYERDDVKLGCGIYQYTTARGERRDYSDNCERFIFFQRAVLEALPLLDWWPDVVHANDWQSGLVPVFLRENYARMGRPAQRERFQQIRTLFTIHNLAYQGNFWFPDWYMLNLPERLFHPDYLEFYGQISFMKGGIVYADAISTVSPTYAREIQTAYYGCGMQGALLARNHRLYGIVNGIDDQVWNPARDEHLAATYAVDTLAQGKAACKRALQQEYKLEIDPRVPLLGIVSRLAAQKGLDLLHDVAPYLMQQNVQLVVLGQGDPIFEEFLTKLRDQHPGRIGLAIDFGEAMAHRIEAGADMFLMPSQYEPCGLNQLYSLKYGTVPIVRRTGGLADTVVDATPENLAAGTATGFVFIPYSPEALFGAIQRAVEMYRHHPDAWRRLQTTGMRQDWSWRRSAAEYEKRYHELLAMTPDS
jgi:starch synthase